MSNLIIEINADNDVFDGDQIGKELGRILTTLVPRLNLDRATFGATTEFRLRDLNGNTVGTATINIDEEEE